MGAVVDERTIAGRYRLTARIGEGGMGVVWRAEDTRLRRIVAVKELLTRNGFDADSAKRAVREGRIAARLQHPNVIALYDVIEDEGRPWLVMEYLPSRSLAGILADRGALPPDEARRIGRQLTAGLAAAHDAGVVHRDVKPGNVLVTEFGTVKVTDFGTSRVAGEGTLTGSGLLVGTPAYLAPEVARGGEPGFPADVFGVGATLYAAVEGTPPFGLDGNPIVLLHRAAEGKYAPPANAGSLEPVLTRLLDPDPDTRPSMAEAVRMLAEDSVEPPTVLASALPAAAATRIVVPPAPAEKPPAGTAPPAADPTAQDVAAQDAAAQDSAAQDSAAQDSAAQDAAAGDSAAQAPAAQDSAAQGQAAQDHAARGPAAPPPTGDRAAGSTPAATTPLPAGSSASPTAHPAPADAPPARVPHPGAPPAPPDGEPEPNRKRAVLLATGVLAALLVVALVVWLNRGDGDPSPAAQGTGSGTPTSAPSDGQPDGQSTGGTPPVQPPPTRQPTTTTEQPTTTTTAQQATTTPPPQPAGPDQALIAYYGLLPEDTEAGFARLTDRFKADRNQTLATYRQFWSDKQDILLDGVQVDGDRVTATVTYVYKNGSTLVERHRYTLVRAGDGWAIDHQADAG